jgi:hypothetical protein
MHIFVVVELHTIHTMHKKHSILIFCCISREVAMIPIVNERFVNILGRPHSMAILNDIVAIKRHRCFNCDDPTRKSVLAAHGSLFDQSFGPPNSPNLHNSHHADVESAQTSKKYGPRGKCWHNGALILGSQFATSEVSTDSANATPNVGQKQMSK